MATLVEDLVSQGVCTPEVVEAVSRQVAAQGNGRLTDALALLGWAVTRVIAGRRYRYVKVGVLVCGALICLVPLWFTFTNVVNLLPANL